MYKLKESWGLSDGEQEEPEGWGWGEVTLYKAKSNMINIL